jgi:hypothetical protein
MVKYHISVYKLNIKSKIIIENGRKLNRTIKTKETINAMCDNSLRIWIVNIFRSANLVPEP